MPRPPRSQEPGIFHVGAESVTSRALFFDNDDRRAFLGLVNATYERYSLSVLSYCLLSTHYHLIIETTEPDISRSLQWLNSRFAESMNADDGDKGHLFGARFWSKRITTDEQLLATVRYLALNPVEAGICAAPDDWPWSSYSVLVHGSRRPPFLHARRVLQLFDGDARVAISRLRAFVELGVAVGA